MARRETNICDCCNETVAKKKCKLCGNDMCEGCQCSIGLHISGVEFELSDDETCKSCEERIFKQFQIAGSTNRLPAAVKDEILKQIRRLVVKEVSSGEPADSIVRRA